MQFLLFALLVSVLPISAKQSCDFCPEPGRLDSDDAYCSELLRLSRSGTLYDNEAECNLNVPILARRCKCSVPPSSPNQRCDLCENTSGTPMTISNPSGKIPFHENEYSCTEILYSARNGGLNSSQCESIAMNEFTSECGGCVRTEICNADQELCRRNQVLAASNPHNYPGSSKFFSSAITCQELIEGARKGELLSKSGCNVLKSSIGAAFQPGAFALGVFDLKACGLQCNYDGSEPEGIIAGDVLLGRGEDVEFDSLTDVPSLLPSDGPSLLPSIVPSFQDNLPSEIVEISMKDLQGSKSSTIGSAIGTETDNCLICDFDRDSTFYFYKDFGDTGTTFFEALSAPDHRAHCQAENGECNPKEPLYPDLENCYLTDVLSFNDLIAIQAVIPPNKAAYVAVFKDTMSQLLEAKDCNKAGCHVENYKQSLIYGDGKRINGEIGTNRSEESINDNVCPGLREGWINYGSNHAVPSDLWQNGQPSYCYSGPIQNAAAVWPVHQSGSNYGDMRDVNPGWKLTGAVYKCCKSLHTCTLSISTLS